MAFTSPVTDELAKSIAFYLPQFHPIPENDEWWGKGFTDWTNVRRAKPRFSDHYQPHVPSAPLGYYDLRDPDARARQASLAEQYKIDAFCYYHYWFRGRRLLEAPFEAVRSSGTPSLDFALCWANESWRRNWDGRTGEVLIEESYDPQDDAAHAEYLATVFSDPRYVRHRGRPLFLIYKASRLPQPSRTTDCIRQASVGRGLPEPYIVRVESSRTEHGDPSAVGCDAATMFVPRQFRRARAARMAVRELAAKLKMVSDARVNDAVRTYASEMQRALTEPTTPYRRFPCVMPGWDNSARRDRGAVIYTGATPELYRQWVATALRRESKYHPDGSWLFVNAWNEWAEGAHLEPCERWGTAFLEAHRDAVDEVRASLEAAR